VIGDSLIQSAFSTDASVTDTSTLTVGVGLQAICGLAVAAIGLALLRILSRTNQLLARGYLAFRVLECAVIFGVGAYMVGADTFVESYELVIYAFTGIGGLMLAYLLRTAGLVPRWLASLGMIGYAAILLAIPSDLLGIVALDSSVGT
jgi:hypothetical protein